MNWEALIARMPDPVARRRATLLSGLQWRELMWSYQWRSLLDDRAERLADAEKDRRYFERCRREHEEMRFDRD